MDRAVRILHLEDELPDVELATEALRSAGIACEVTRVDAREAFEAALENTTYDLVLADFKLPSYDGQSALAYVRERWRELPFIIVSGTLGEDAAIDSLIAGATDYVLKHRLGRLAPAVLRALREAENARARSRSDRALRASELRYRKLFEGSADGILILDATTGRIVDANAAAAELLGFAVAELLGFTPQEIDIVEEHLGATASFRDVLLEDRAYLEDVQVRSKDGAGIAVDVRSSAFEVEGRRIVQCSIRDITERKRLQEQLRRSQKLEAVGRLAGGVAHDFNNILVAMNGYVDLAIDALDEGSPVRQDLLEVRRACGRAASLTRQLLAFSSKQSLHPTVLCPNAAVTGLEPMLRRVIGDDITLDLDLSPALVSVRADPAQLEQVVMNLVVNARDAMPRGGRLRIRTENVEIAAGERRPGGRAPGCYALVTVQDSGCGMDEHTMARIFEPFFTTKPVGKGTGLGLSIVYGIVKQSGGTIEVESERGKGAAFRIYLPSAGTQAAAAAVAAPPSMSLSGTETILVVEDDEKLQALAARVLGARGYRILTASSGAEAQRVAESLREPIHLLLSDVVLPGIDGYELAGELAAARPSMRTLFMSGFTGEHAAPAKIDGAAFLAKPFTPSDLLQKVRQVLDVRPAPDRAGAAAPECDGGIAR